MEILISSLALIVSIFALLNSIKTKQLKEKISLFEQRNSLRIQVQKTTYELANLIDKILIFRDFDERVKTLNNLVRAAEGLAKVYTSLEKKINHTINLPINFLTELSIEYKDLSSRLTEFEIVLNQTKEYFNSEKFERLFNSSEGLKTRIWGE